MIKKDIYDLYLMNKFDENTLIIKLNSLEEKLIKEDGVVYTPWNIVQKMIEIADPSKEMNILEPSCGHGIFLIGLLKFIEKKYNLSGEQLFDWFKHKVLAIEISKSTVSEVKEILSAFFKKHFNLIIESVDFNNIKAEDSLMFEHSINFDLCIGNPPYVRAKNIEKSYLKYLKENYLSCAKGTVDIYFAFIEKYLKISKNLVFITPNSFLTNKSGDVLREQLFGRLKYFVNFEGEKIFKEANIYTCIFKASEDYSENFLYGNNIDNVSLLSKSNYIKKELYVKEEIFKEVYSGIATLADSLYVVKKNADGKFYANFENLFYEIEKDVIVPYLKLTKIRSNDDLKNVDYMIFPYINKVIIAEDILAKKFPNTYKYLLAIRERLSQRDKGKTEGYESWYAYGRKQGLTKFSEHSIICIPKMIGGNCKPVRLDISNLLSEYSQIVFTSGYVILEVKLSGLNYQIFLENSFMDFVRKNGRIWPGKEENYFSLSVKHIKGFKE